MPNTTEPTICCSFCGRPADQVPRIITGYTAHICSDCVDACKELLHDEYERDNFMSAEEALAFGLIDKVIERH